MTEERKLTSAAELAEALRKELPETLPAGEFDLEALIAPEMRTTKTTILQILELGQILPDKIITTLGLDPNDTDIVLARAAGTRHKLQIIANNVLATPLEDTLVTLESLEKLPENSLYSEVRNLLRNPLNVLERDIGRLSQDLLTQTDLKQLQTTKELREITNFFSEIGLKIHPGNWLNDEIYNLEYFVTFLKGALFLAKQLNNRIGGTLNGRERVKTLLKFVYLQGDLKLLENDLRNLQA